MDKETISKAERKKQFLEQLGERKEFLTRSELSGLDEVGIAAKIYCLINDMDYDTINCIGRTMATLACHHKL